MLKKWSLVSESDPKAFTVKKLPFWKRILGLQSNAEQKEIKNGWKLEQKRIVEWQMKDKFPFKTFSRMQLECLNEKWRHNNDNLSQSNFAAQ